MFILVRAATYSALFIGLVLVFLPRPVLSMAGVAQPAAMGPWQITGMVLGFVGGCLALSCIFTFVVLGKDTPALRQSFGPDYESYCGTVGRWWPKR